MKKYLIDILIFFVVVGGIFILLYFRSKSHIQHPGSQYIAGEIIYPDYAHGDTLVVIDPDGLNDAMAVSEGTDWDINTILHRYCAVLGQEMPDYGMDMYDDAYILYDYTYKDTMVVKWGTNFDSLMYNWND